MNFTRFENSIECLILKDFFIENMFESIKKFFKIIQ